MQIAKTLNKLGRCSLILLVLSWDGSTLNSRIYPTIMWSENAAKMANSIDPDQIRLLLLKGSCL